MKKTPKKFDVGAVHKIGLTLPGVEEGVAWGSPALKLKGKWISVIPTHKSAEPDSLAVRVDFERREELLAEAPDVFYVKPHYVGYPVVLVRLSKVAPEAMKDLLIGACRHVAAESAAKRRPRSN